jgi:hypothetical protein
MLEPAVYTATTDLSFDRHHDHSHARTQSSCAVDIDYSINRRLAARQSLA